MVMPMTLHDMLPAMLIMVVPAFVICAGITFLALRGRNRDAKHRVP
jgi:hypothetical protein